MATLAAPRPTMAGDERFFLTAAILMTLVVIAGFSVQLAAGRSSFGAPWPLHVHALLFFGWGFFYLLQNILIGTGNVARHKQLGWLAAVFVPAMVVVGVYITVSMVQRGAVPFFFAPAYFLIMDPLALFVFAGFVAAAIRMRRRTDWHRRLMLCGMAVLTGPAIGRLLPMPFLAPWAGLAVFSVLLIWPLAGMAADRRRHVSVHPAWFWGVAVLLAMQLVIEVAGRGPIGAALARSVATGTPGERVDPLAYPPPPEGLLITGR